MLPASTGDVLPATTGEVPPRDNGGNAPRDNGGSAPRDNVKHTQILVCITVRNRKPLNLHQGATLLIAYFRSVPHDAICFLTRIDESYFLKRSLTLSIELIPPLTPPPLPPREWGSGS